jgi:c-di-GMP-binding flagellar brake protein YcgR
MEYAGPERRKSSRLEHNFVVSYRVLEEDDNVDITQTKNIGSGGMWLTTNREFDAGTKLALKLRLPLHPDEMTIIAKVVESREVVSNLIYDTHLEFISLDENYKKSIDKTVDYYQKEKQEEEKE